MHIMGLLNESITAHTNISESTQQSHKEIFMLGINYPRWLYPSELEVNHTKACKKQSIQEVTKVAPDEDPWPLTIAVWHVMMRKQKNTKCSYCDLFIQCSF